MPRTLRHLVGRTRLWWWRQLFTVACKSVVVRSEITDTSVVATTHCRSSTESVRDARAARWKLQIDFMKMFLELVLKYWQDILTSITNVKKVTESKLNSSFSLKVQNRNPCLLLVRELSQQECNSKVVEVKTRHFSISSFSMKTFCPSLTSLTLRAMPGQHLNISMLNFNLQQTGSVASLRDVITNNVKEVTSGGRSSHIMTSSGSEVELIAVDWMRSNDVNLMFKIDGCWLQTDENS